MDAFDSGVEVMQRRTALNSNVPQNGAKMIFNRPVIQSDAQPGGAEMIRKKSGIKNGPPHSAKERMHRLNSLARVYPIFLTGLLAVMTVQSHAGMSLRLISGKGLIVDAVRVEDRVLKMEKPVPFLTFEVNDTLVSLADMKASVRGETYSFEWNGRIQGSVHVEKTEEGWKARIFFKNTSGNEISIANVVPLGQSREHIYLTAAGPWSLARTRIYRPGYGPVGVILPDNAWELGYSALPLSSRLSLCALSRRQEAKHAREGRWKTVLEPGGEVVYAVFADLYEGEWQNGLKLMFQRKYLFDLESFDETLFNREDLRWIRGKYTLGMQFSWDHEFFDSRKGGYTIDRYLDMGDRLFGGWDGLGLWTTWPTLGIDRRNQWDITADLPGGLARIRKLSASMKERGVRLFVVYNPWDESTRGADPCEGLADLIKSTDADGVILDCAGNSSPMLQVAADRVKPGVIMYSEGMAVPVDMPGIVAGRVHDAIFLPPPLNLNKLIRPDFAIFRVCQLSQGRLHREFAISFFNGYGIELNVFEPGREEWLETDYRYWGRLVRILKENSGAFLSPDWTPLIPAHKDSIWVNEWPDGEKILYTVFSLIPEGFRGPLFPVPVSEGYHYVSLYHHEELDPVEKRREALVPVHTEGFDRAYLGTRMEGNVDCIARLPEILEVRLDSDSLFFSASRGDSVRIWPGMPAYGRPWVSFQTAPRIITSQTLKLKIERPHILAQDKAGLQNRMQENARLKAGKVYAVKLMDLFGRYEGKVVVQCLEQGTLLDERVVYLKPGTPRLISRVMRTPDAVDAPDGMIRIPGGPFLFRIEKKESRIPYPDFSEGKQVKIGPFYMDRFPVTNREYKEFLEATNYQPEDTARHLKHWKDGTFLPEETDFPVVHVSLEDANAYALWAGKRLPTEMEWQYAAQGTDGRLWPWGSVFDSTRCNAAMDHPTPVNRYPEGKSPFGIMDLVGNVWQLTGDVYDNGSHYYIMIRGGSHFNPVSSEWYVKGGPQPLNQTQFLLRVSPGFERNATVGFRCVKDAK